MALSCRGRDEPLTEIKRSALQTTSEPDDVDLDMRTGEGCVSQVERFATLSDGLAKNNAAAGSKHAGGQFLYQIVRRTFFC
jgi:hypothetical protein